MEGFLLVVFQILVVLFSIVIHEVSHGLMAYSLGDQTAKNAGRLTLNPLPHLDIFGSVLLPLLTYSLGGFIFGYAKPVPYNPLYLSDRKFGPAKVGFAGPASNILIALVFGLILRFLPNFLQATILPELFSFIVLINLILAIFNLLPVPPLDGHWLLLSILPERFYGFKMFYLRYGLFLFLLVLIFVLPLIFPLVFKLFRLIVG
ncbi:MAG: site-2 protease family protein [Parcubacteria group bacterium]|nr:site-2 protease family protein [Parcubacteria group bacterium]